MAKLSKLHSHLAAPLQTRESQRGERPVPSGRFSGLLQQVATQGEATSRLEVWQSDLTQIEQTGQQLQRSPTRSVLREYRRLIQGFLQHSLKDLYELDQVLGRVNLTTGHRKKYSLIRVIDQKLEQLVQSVLREQNANLQLLQRIEEIHGLLVNLLS